jgi:hypothetical protein
MSEPVPILTSWNKDSLREPAQLATADAVLRAALFDDSTRQRASRVPSPPE